jgi:SnoaL-like protein
MDTAVAAELLAAIAERDFGRIAACFAPDSELRALTPHQLRELAGPGSIAAQYRFWLEPLSAFSVVDSGFEAVADRIRIRYRFVGIDPEHGPQENEHTAYAEVNDSRIAALNLSCAGFRPAEPGA